MTAPRGLVAPQLVSVANPTKTPLLFPFCCGTAGAAGASGTVGAAGATGAAGAIGVADAAGAASASDAAGSSGARARPPEDFSSVKFSIGAGPPVPHLECPSTGAHSGGAPLIVSVRAPARAPSKFSIKKNIE